MRPCWQVLAALLLVSTLRPAWAGLLAVHVQGANDDFRTAFLQQLEAQTQQIQLVDNPDESDVLIALGNEAFRQAQAHEPPVLGVFISRPVSEKVESKGCHCAAIWAGVALEDQLSMLVKMQPLARRVGVVLGETSAWTPGMLQDYQGAVSLKAMQVAPGNALGDVLRRQLPELDALLLPVDETLFGPAAAKLILLTSYRLRRPVFGPEQTYVHAGSTASLYVSVSDLVSEVRVHLDSFRKHKRFRRSGFVHTPSVMVNEHVANSFDMRFSHAESLRQALEMWP